MVSPSDYLEDDGASADWGRLGRDLVGGVILAIFSGIIATIVAVRDMMEAALGGVQTWYATVIETVERLVVLTISEVVTTAGVDLSVASIVFAMAAVLAAYYVVAWGVSRAW